MKNALILAVLLFSIKTITAQDTKTFPEKEFSFIIGPSFTNVKNDNLLYDQYGSSKGTNWFNLGINYCKYINKNFGFLIGLEYSMYKNVTTYKGAFRSTELSQDPYGNDYYAVSEANYKNTRTIQGADVPIGLRLQVPVGESSVFFVDLGVRLNFVASAKTESKGTMETKGAYPTNFSNVFFYVEDDSYYGFTNKTYSSETDIPVNRVNLSYFIGGGIKAKIANYKYVIINPAYMSGLNDVIKKDSRIDYVNVFGEKIPHKKYTISQFALRIGIVFEM